MNISPTIKTPIDKKDCSFLEKQFGCSLFLQAVLSIGCLKEWFNLQSIDIYQLDWNIEETDTYPIYVIPSIGNIQLKSKHMMRISPSTSINTIYYYYAEYPEECLSMLWFQLCSKLVASNEYKSSVDIKLVVEDLLFKQIDPLLVDCIKNNTLQYINIDTCPRFEYLLQQTLKAFSNSVNIVSPPLLSKLTSFFKSDTDKSHFIHRCNRILTTCQYLIQYKTSGINVYKYPKLEQTIGKIYPQEEIPSNYIDELKSVYRFWLSGGDIQFQPLSFYTLLTMYQQQCYTTLFQSYTTVGRPLPYTLSQVKSIQNIKELEDVVGKFLYGKRRTYKQDELVSTFCKKYKNLDDLTFYNECKQYYHPSPFDRSIARIRELDQLSIWDKIESPYLDFGGGDGQNAYAISKKMGFTKGNVFVSDIQSWFGNENVEKYKDICTYRFLKTYKCPFEDNTFSFITCFQVLHHIRDYVVSLTELYRICKPGGILYIREHDAISDEVRTLIDIEHSLHEVTGNPSVSLSYLQDYFAHYFTMSELSSLLVSVGFKPLINDKTNKQYTTESVGPTRYTISIWTK